MRDDFQSNFPSKLSQREVQHQLFIQDFANGQQWGTFLHWRTQKFSLFSNWEFFKHFKKAMKIYNFLNMLKEILRFLKIF